MYTKPRRGGKNIPVLKVFGGDPDLMWFGEVPAQEPSCWG